MKKNSTQTTASPIRKLNTLLALRSSRSNPLRALVFPCLIVSSLMHRFKYLLGEYVIRGQKRHRIQVAEEVSQPQAAHRYGDNHVRPSHAQSSGKVRFDHPEKVEVAHQHQPNRQPDQPPHVTLEGARKQQDKRHGKVE